MSFLYPYVLCALLLPLLLAAAVILVSRGSGRGWRRLVSAAHEGELVTRRPAWRTVLPAALCLAALTCAIAALARPINGYHEAGAQVTGRNLLLALDISRSMETQDVKPSRLEEARAAAYELIEALPNDKIGLIVFSGTADLVVPLTYDHTALRDALEQVNRGWAGSGGTNFGLVLKKAMQDFKRSAPDGTNALVILSDGEDTVDSDRHIGATAKENHLMVVTVGIGTAAGGPIPDERGDNGLWQDENGKHVISKLDAASLQEFAKETGGSYFLMGPNADISTFARQTVQKLDAHEEEFSVNKVPNDLFAYFAAAALLLTVLAVLLATDWRAPRRVSMLLLLPLLLPQAWAASAEAVSAYRAGLRQMQGDPAKAAEAFSRALLDADTRLQAACHYELGNMATNATFGELRALYGDASAQSEEGLAEQPQQQQVTPEALQQIVDKLKQNKTPYTDALKADPALKAAESNIAKIDALIKKLEEEIERLKQQQNQDNQQDQQQNQDDKQQNQSDHQQNQDKQQDQQQNGQDKQDDKQNSENKQDKQNGEDKQDEQQDKQNGEDEQDEQQDKQNGEDKQDEQQDKQDEQQDKQNGEDKQDEQQQQQNPQEQQQQDEQQAPQPEMSDKEKAERRAASILQMHIDEENGSPIPHHNDNPRPPKKDY